MLGIALDFDRPALERSHERAPSEACEGKRGRVLLRDARDEPLWHPYIGKLFRRIASDDGLVRS